MRKFTEGEPRSMVENLEERDGWSAYRALCSGYAPSLNQDKGNIVAVLGNLNKEQARRPQDMRKLMIKLAKVSKKFEELLHEPVQDSVLRGILTNMCDKETKAYITPYAHESYKALKKRIEEWLAAKRAERRAARGG